MDVAQIGRLLGACAVIALVLVAVQFVARCTWRPRLRTGVSGRLISVVETEYLPNAASLHVVRVAERYFAVGRSGATFATLCEIPHESVRLRETRLKPAFFERLRRSRP